MKNYVVTGGAGFIGSALARKLLERGDGRVTVVDNLYSGRMSNLAEIAAQIEFHKVDIRDYEAIAAIVKGADTVFHLAAQPSVPRSIQDPVSAHTANIDGTFNVLLACKDGGVRRYVFAASSSAYGDTEVLPKVETMPANPKSPYALHKVTGEQYAKVFHECWGLETVCLRFFNVFGPRQDPGSPYSGVLSLFMKHLLAGTTPAIFGDGEQSRDFTFVDDVTTLIVKAAHAGPQVAGKLYNAGNGGRYTLNQTWEMLQNIEGVSIPAVYGPARVGDVRHSQADTFKAVAELAHDPRYSFEQGLRETLEWYRHNQ